MSMYAGILTFGFIMLRISETVMFTIVMTKSTATPIRKPFFTEVVTATAGQSDSASRKTGFSENIPFLMSVNRLVLFSAIPQLLLERLHRVLHALGHALGRYCRAGYRLYLGIRF